AVNSNTNAIYLIRGSGATERWGLDGTGETVVDGSGGSSLAVDPGSGNVYVGKGTSVAVYDSENNSVDPSTLTGVGNAAGIAWGTTAPLLYVADSTNNDVATFGPPQP